MRIKVTHGDGDVCEYEVKSVEIDTAWTAPTIEGDSYSITIKASPFEEKS